MPDEFIDAEKVRFEYEPPYHPGLSAEQIARIEQSVTERVIRPMLRDECGDDK